MTGRLSATTSVSNGGPILSGQHLRNLLVTYYYLVTPLLDTLKVNA